MRKYQYYYRKGKIRTLERFSPSTPLHIPLWLNKVKEHPYFNEFECYLTGSLLWNEESGDMDIFYSGKYEPEKLVSLLDYSLQCGFDLNIKMDVMYIPDYSYLENPPYFTDNKSYDVYTSYDFEMLLEDGKMTLFRDYKTLMVDGLFRSKHYQYHKKSVERGIRQGNRLKKLN